MKPEEIEEELTNALSEQRKQFQIAIFRESRLKYSHNFMKYESLLHNMKNTE